MGVTRRTIRGVKGGEANQSSGRSLRAALLTRGANSAAGRLDKALPRRPPWGVVNGPIHFQLGRFLVVFGIILVVLGLVVMAGAKHSFWGLGRLPGDIAFKGKNAQFYFPVVTCLVLSALVTVVLWLVSFLTRK